MEENNLNKRLALAVVTLLALLLTGCADESNAGHTDSPVDAVTTAYYEGQNDPAYAALQQHDLEPMLQNWVGRDAENPKWNFNRRSDLTCGQGLTKFLRR